MRAFVFCLLGMVCAVNCLAQGERNNWFFGDSAGITFNNSNAPTILINANIRTAETAASISDKTGNVIFYSGGNYPALYPNSFFANVKSYNSLNMQNSTVIKSHYSITQGQIILPNPANSHSYYLFSIDYQPPLGTKLYYNTIDMLLDSGRGQWYKKMCFYVILQFLRK
ncbi:MAG: hypothetical protein JNK61_05085 [Bacteroidia bacterium]|nr:hypothetical protein [Bacteroidia bacterium]